MNPAPERTESEGLLALRASYAAGRYAEAHRSAMTLWQTGPEPERRQAALVAVQAAYRWSELGTASELLPAATAAWGESAQAPERFDLLAVAVVVHGELGDYAASIEALRQLHSHSARVASLRNHIRARGTAAVCLALLGDPWAALRLLTEAASHLVDLGHIPEASALESTVRSNHAAVCLQAARMMRDIGDTAACDALLDDAAQSNDRTRELAALRQDARLGSFSDVHAAEAALLRRQPELSIEPLQHALAHAKSLDLPGQARRLALMLAQALTESGDAAAADRLLDEVEASMHAGHEVSSHLSLHEQRHAARFALGDTAGALQALQRWQALQQKQHASLLAAQSRFLRLRLELEHLYRQPWRSTP